jgi:predicted ferric reductase
MSTVESITWEVARAGGLTAYILLSGSVMVGLTLSLNWQSSRWPRLMNTELHNFLTLLASIFVGIHILAVLVDPFTHFGLHEVLLPFASHYRPVWMAFGIVGLYLGIAILLSTWLRPKIGYLVWRRLHMLTLVLFAAVTIHGIATGTDTSSGWIMDMYVISSLVVALLLLLRIRRSYLGNRRAGEVSNRRQRAVPELLSGPRSVQ